MHSLASGASSLSDVFVVTTCGACAVLSLTRRLSALHHLLDVSLSASRRMHAFNIVHVFLSLARRPSVWRRFVSCFDGHD